MSELQLILLNFKVNRAKDVTSLVVVLASLDISRVGVMANLYSTYYVMYPSKPFKKLTLH